MKPKEPQEVLDVVDENDQVIGRAPRSEVHARHLRHRAVHVLLFNAQGDLFVQKRSATKDTFPRCYDSSASGHLNQGEEYDDCARREIQEELGLDMPMELLHRQFKIDACDDTGWEFVWVYRVVTGRQPVINLEELESGEFWTRDHAESMVRTNPEQFARSFVRVFNESDDRRLWPIIST